MAATQQCGHQPPLKLIEEVIIEVPGVRVSFAFALMSKHNRSAKPDKETIWELHQLRAELEAVRYQNQCYALEKAEWLEDRRNLCLKLQKLKQDLLRMEELQKQKELTEEHQTTSQGVCLYQEQFSSLEVQLSSGQGDDVHQPSPQQISQGDTDLLRPGSGEDARSRWLTATKKNLERNGITFLNDDTFCEARDLQRKLAGKENLSDTERKEAQRKKKAKREQKEKKRPDDQEKASSPRVQKSNILLKAVRDILTYMGRSCRRKQCSPRLKEELKAVRKELKRWMKDQMLSSPPPSGPPPLLQIIVQCPTASKQKHTATNTPSFELK